MQLKNFSYKNWYALASDKIKASYNEDSKLFCGLLASASPRMGLTRNYNIAKAIYEDFKKNPNDFYRYALNEKQAIYKKYIIWHSHYNNIMRVLYNYIYEYKNDLKLEGLKVNNFYQNLLGNKNAITLDTWMARHYKHAKSFLSIGDYKRISKLIIRHAKRLELAPSELQAILWINVREKAGFKPLYFHEVIK